MRLLIIEDDFAFANTLRNGLRTNFVVDVAYSCKEGRTLLEANHYDCLILDLTLPDGHGRDICRQLRERKNAMPVLILSGKDAIDTKVELLDIGADDYLTKPFHLSELQARIRALTRRKSHMVAVAPILRAGDLSLDPERREVKRADAVVSLRRKEFDILEYLLRNQGRVVTRTMILDHVWAGEMEPFTNAVDVHMKYLRDQVDRPYSHKLLKTVHGVGHMIDNH